MATTKTNPTRSDKMQMALNFNSRPLRVVDLCCGAGLASLAFAELGYEILAAVDTNETALDVYGNWSGHCASAVGVEEVAAEYDIGKADIVVCGPPCQDDSRLGKMHADKGRGALKSPTFQAALNYNPTWIVMEMNSTDYLTWCEEHGARQTFKLVDHEQGGYTLRKRWFAVWGPSDLEIAKVPQADRKGWGEAVGIEADMGYSLVSESIGLKDRQRLARTADQPCHAVIGHGTSHIMHGPDGYRERLSAECEAALQGFGGLGMYDHLDGLTREQKQTAIGNGWAKSFGLTIGKAVQRAMAGLNQDGCYKLAEIDGKPYHAKGMVRWLDERDGNGSDWGVAA
jgi:site-specific DNA-cytosine methylase